METPSTSVSIQISGAGIIWLKLAILYLLLGIGMGIAMGATETFTLRPVHAHINLLGWVSMGLIGIIYTLFARAAASPLARVHFWMHNLSLPIMMAALAMLLQGNRAVIPVIAASEIVMLLGTLVFAFNVFKNVKSD
ncbi:MAG: cytochrome-c oxidase [Pseudomonadota bacterium]